MNLLEPATGIGNVRASVQAEIRHQNTTQTFFDFENASNIEYDNEGNVISRNKHNPTDIAKKCIYRADILWNELKKKGIVS